MKGIFESFTKNDIKGILERLSEDVNWHVSGPQQIPYAGKRAGKEKVDEFFRLIGKSITHDKFEPQEFIARDDKVVVIGSEKFKVKFTNKAVINDWIMVFTLKDGKVIRFFEYGNTAVIANAFK
ncbi:MAG: nuclear transport factor 2 family protein [Planctomycetes bacterium]|nr:nuclear transport factor 2 family protein [Planctomycetota bacterium]